MIVKKIFAGLLSVVLLGTTGASIEVAPDHRRLAVDGQVIRDAGGTGRIVDLRGTNLGGWLLQEGWMSPAGEAALDRNGWTASASVTEAGGDESLAVDGDPASRWSSGQPQAAGQSFTVDLGVAVTFDQVSFDAGTNTGDYPAGYELRASLDGTRWWPIGTGTGAGQLTTVTGTYQNARYISIVLTADKPGNWWSITDFRVYVSDEYNTRRVLTQRFGRATADHLIDSYQSTWIQAADLDNIRAMGFNTVRVPIDYQVLTYPDGTMRPDSDAFGKLDWLVTEARARRLYVILDLHGTPGAHCPWHSCGRAGSNQLWNNPDYQDLTTAIWRRLAAHFRGESTVAAYDLLNEPLVTMGAVESAAQVRQKFDFFHRLYTAVREVDPAHIIMVAAFPSWDQALPPSAYGWTNVVYEVHSYNFAAQDDHAAMRSFVDAELAGLAWHRSAWAVPVYAGEFWFGAFDDLYTRWLDGLNDNHVSWTNWTYKVKNGPDSIGPDGIRNGDHWSFYRGNPHPVPDINTDTAAVIEAKWRAFGTADFLADTQLQRLYQGPAAEPADSPLPGVVEAEAFATQTGLRPEPTADAGGGTNLGWADPGDAATYDVSVATEGQYQIVFRVASPDGAANAFTVAAGSATPAVVSVPRTEGWQSWADVAVIVELAAGTQALTVRVTAPGWNLNRFRTTATTNTALPRPTGGTSAGRWPPRVDDRGCGLACLGG